jgi:hypothetical protein
LASQRLPLLLVLRCAQVQRRRACSAEAGGSGQLSSADTAAMLASISASGMQHSSRRLAGCKHLANKQHTFVQRGRRAPCLLCATDELTGMSGSRQHNTSAMLWQQGGHACTRGRQAAVSTTPGQRYGNNEGRHVHGRTRHAHPTDIDASWSCIACMRHAAQRPWQLSRDFVQPVDMLMLLLHSWLSPKSTRSSKL